jgi:hypothetical protein
MKRSTALAILVALFPALTLTPAATAGDLPDPHITPGLADPALTKDILCAPGFSTRSIRNVPSARRKAIYKVYGMAANQPPCPCEVDHLKRP